MKSNVEKQSKKSPSSVLIVDDEQFLRKILGRIISREGFSVDEATNGQQALDKMQSNNYDVVISDICMPSLNGIELLKEIKEHHQDTSVVLITGYAGEYTIDEMMTAGADYFISKPFKNIEISQMLKELKRARSK